MPPNRRRRNLPSSISSITDVDPDSEASAPPVNTRTRAAKAASMAATRVIFAPRLVNAQPKTQPKTQPRTQPKPRPSAPKRLAKATTAPRGPPTPVTHETRTPSPEDESDDSDGGGDGGGVERARKWRETVVTPRSNEAKKAEKAEKADKAVAVAPRTPAAPVGPSRTVDETLPMSNLPMFNAHTTPRKMPDMRTGNIFPHAPFPILYNTTSQVALVPFPQRPFTMCDAPLIDPHLAPLAPQFRGYPMDPPASAAGFRDWRAVDYFIPASESRKDRSVRATHRSAVNPSPSQRPERQFPPPNTTLPRVLDLKDLVPLSEDDRVMAMGLDAMYAERRAGYDAARAEIEAELDADIATLRASYAARFTELEGKHAAEIKVHNQMVEAKAAALRAAARRSADHTHIDTEDRDEVAALANYLTSLDWDNVDGIDDLLRDPFVQRSQRMMWKYKYLLDDNVPALRALSVTSRDREALEAERLAAASGHRSVSEPLEEREAELVPEPEPPKKKARRRR